MIALNDKSVRDREELQDIVKYIKNSS